jgi:nucleoside-diphosphate-sugar epimerase
MLALKTKKAKGEMFNIATGTASSINELVLNLQEIMEKKDLKPVHKASRAGDIKHSYASIEKANRILGYKPQFSFKQGLTELVEWYSKREV